MATVTQSAEIEIPNRNRYDFRVPFVHHDTLSRFQKYINSNQIGVNVVPSADKKLRLSIYLPTSTPLEYMVEFELRQIMGEDAIEFTTILPKVDLAPKILADFSAAGLTSESQLTETLGVQKVRLRVMFPLL